jgi:hypothetical protein
MRSDKQLMPVQAGRGGHSAHRDARQSDLDVANQEAIKPGESMRSMTWKAALATKIAHAQAPVEQQRKVRSKVGRDEAPTSAAVAIPHDTELTSLRLHR